MKRIAIVGCGTIAKVHGLAIQDAGFECVAVTDIRPEAAKAYAAAYPLLRADFLQAPEWMTASARTRLGKMFRPPEAVPDLAAMGKEQPPDVVIIATHPATHCELTCQAAAIGAKIVLCEKPMAMGVDECRRMIDVCTKHGTRLAVYHESMTLLDQFREGRRIVSGGQIGAVEFVRAQTASTLMDWSPYLWAGLLHLCPGMEITRIEAALDLTNKKISFGHAQEDRASVFFELDGRIPGVLLTGRKGAPHAIRIDGVEGAIEAAFLGAPTLRHWRQGTRSWEVVTPPREVMYSDRRDFLSGIATGDPFYDSFTAESALRSTRPVFATWQSHLERRPVSHDEPVTANIPQAHV